MLAYVATKDQFLQDAPIIEDLVRDKVQSELGINISRNSSEFLSWRNSLGNAMYHVINSSGLPSDAGIAIEYRLHGRVTRHHYGTTHSPRAWDHLVPVRAG